MIIISFTPSSTQVNTNTIAPKPYNYPPMAAPKSPSMAAPKSPSYPPQMQYQQPQQQQGGAPAWSQPSQMQQQQQNNYNNATLPRANAPSHAPAGQYYYYNN